VLGIVEGGGIGTIMGVGMVLGIVVGGAIMGVLGCVGASKVGRLGSFYYTGASKKLDSIPKLGSLVIF